MEEIARLSGVPELPRKSIFHALNQKAVAKRYAKEQSLSYEDINVIVAHMGGGVSVGAHKKGKIVDVNNALDGEGAFSPERSGGVPSGDLARMCFSGKYTLEEVLKKLTGKGGFVAYLNTKTTALKSELTTSINAVKTTADKNTTDVASVNSAITSINNTLSSLNTTISSMNTTLTAVKEKVDGLVDGNNTAY